MIENQLTGEHIQRTLAYLCTPSFRDTYLKSLYTDEQRKWAEQLLIDFKSGKISQVEIVSGPDSICKRCIPLRKEGCTYNVEPLVLNNIRPFFGLVLIDELLVNFNQKEFFKNESIKEHAFYTELMQHM
jgi:hypothetical protein